MAELQDKQTRFWRLTGAGKLLQHVTEAWASVLSTLVFSGLTSDESVMFRLQQTQINDLISFIMNRDQLRSRSSTETQFSRTRSTLLNRFWLVQFYTGVGFYVCLHCCGYKFIGGVFLCVCVFYWSWRPLFIRREFVWIVLSVDFRVRIKADKFMSVTLRLSDRAVQSLISNSPEAQIWACSLSHLWLIEVCVSVMEGGRKETSGRNHSKDLHVLNRVERPFLPSAPLYSVLMTVCVFCVLKIELRLDQFHLNCLMFS